MAGASITNWLRTLVEIQMDDALSIEVILDLLTDIDDARAERNTVVHGIWMAHDEPDFAWVQTFKWERQDVVRTELWSIGDLHR